MKKRRNITKVIGEVQQQVVCARANFENLMDRYPAMRGSPFYKVVVLQLQEAETYCKMTANPEKEEVLGKIEADGQLSIIEEK